MSLLSLQPAASKHCTDDVVVAVSAEKLFIDSAFYDDPEHKYPTVEEQIALARRVAQSVLAPANVNSRGHKMFVKRRDRSHRWEAGYKPPEPGDAAAADDAAAAAKFVRPEPSTAHAPTDAAASTSASGDVTGPPPAPVPLTTFVFAPKLPDAAEQLDPEKLDALSSEELERVLLMEKKSTHTNIAPQVTYLLLTPPSSSSSPLTSFSSSPLQISFIVVDSDADSRYFLNSHRRYCPWQLV